VASVFIVYWVGFRSPVDEAALAAAKLNGAVDPNAPADANEPEGVADANAPRAADANEGGASADANAPDSTADANEPNEPADPNAPADPNKPAEPDDPMESINLKDMEMKNVMVKLASWTGKTIIPSDEAMKQKITIYAPDKMPRSRALQMIYHALRSKGFVAETLDDVIFLTAIDEARTLGRVPTIPPEVELATLLNKDQIVQKFFDLENYSPTEMAAVIAPLIGEHGHINADENAGSLLVIDTVSNLMRLENIINQFDVPEAEQTVTQVFVIEYGDPSEIVQMLNILLGEGGGRSSSRGSSYDRDRGRSSYGGSSYYRPRPNPEPPSHSSLKKSSSGGATTVTVGTMRGPIVLIPEPRRNWIIARASADDMERIAEWIDKLDKEEPVQSEYEIVNLRYADPMEVEDSIEDGFRDLPGTQFLPSVLVEPLRTSKAVIIFGRKDLREIVKKMIEEIDIAPDMFETRHFPLDYADPDTIKTMIEELFSQSGSSSSYSPYSRYGGYSSFSSYSSRSRGSSASDEVKVISYATLKQITVIASPERMVEVAKQIEEWDKPLDIDRVKPLILTLKNSDPIEMAELLNTLFSEKTTSRMSLYDILYGNTAGKSKIVGPLYGQLTFEDVPGTKKIIVISKIPEAYEVIKQLVLDLDREEMAEVPKVITVKYADPEDLSERLNAMFIDTGQTARVRLTMQGLSESSAMDDPGSDGSSSSSSDSSQSEQGEFTTMPWSGSGARSGVGTEMPLSNVIGRIRFVPEPHTKSIMVLSPPEFMDEIEGLIAELDVPGKQVIIKAIIVEIEHTRMTSLGVEFATNPDAFSTTAQNALTAVANITNAGAWGPVSAPMSAATKVGNAASGAAGSGTILGVGMDVFALIDFLVKRIDARILNQQTLWTKDNEEARFFKGSEVAFSGGTTLLGGQGGSQQNILYKKVGMELRARPSITPENSVDMVINVEISQLTEDREQGQPVISKMDTRTNMIVRDGETLMLGGILFQKDSVLQTKVPGLGDIPLLGGLFRHESVTKSNSELIVFITPHVINEMRDDLSEATKQAIEGPKEKLKEIMGDLETGLEKLGLDQ